LVAAWFTAPVSINVVLRTILPRVRLGEHRADSPVVAITKGQHEPKT